MGRSGVSGLSNPDNLFSFELLARSFEPPITFGVPYGIEPRVAAESLSIRCFVYRQVVSSLPTLLRLALPKLFDDKERNVYRLNSTSYQTFHKSKSVTVNKPEVFQIKSQSQSFFHSGLGRLS